MQQKSSNEASTRNSKQCAYTRLVVGGEILAARRPNVEQRVSRNHAANVTDIQRNLCGDSGIVPTSPTQQLVAEFLAAHHDAMGPPAMGPPAVVVQKNPKLFHLYTMQRA